MNDSIKSLDNTMRKLLMSSTKLGYISTILVLVAIISITLTLVPADPFLAIILVVPTAYLLIQLHRRAGILKKQANASKVVNVEATHA